MPSQKAPGVAMLALLVGCAVGPSTRVTPTPAAPLASRAVTAAPPAARQFLDSLTRVRVAEHADTGAALWRPRALTVDAARDLAWLDVMQDTQLVALVNTAVTNNRDVQAAVARVREYRALVGVARADLYPRVDVVASASVNKVSFGGLAPSRFDALRITGELQWELDFWGRVRRQTEAAGFDRRAHEEDHRAVVLTLVSDVATAYLALKEVDENLRIADETLGSRQATLGLAQRRFAQGVISELDVRQFESEVARSATTVAIFTRQRVEIENQLSVLLGREPEAIPRGRALEQAVQAVAVPESLPGALVVRRPDVLRAQSDWQAATARIGVAIGNRMPTFFVTGTYGTQRPDFDGLFSSRGEVFALQGGVSVPVFHGGRLVNQERAARARADQARANYEQTVLIALGEASNALSGVRLTRDQIVTQQTQAQALRRALALAQQRYESGIASYLEVLDAQRQLFDAELSLVQVQREYLVATVQLYKALGGTWNEARGGTG